MSIDRCAWVNLENPLYVAYHDSEWGEPLHDDQLLFEMIVLEGAQAGLSWETVLNKRAAYREAFDGFDPEKVSEYDDVQVEALMQNAGIIRNRLKIKSAISNAKVVLEIQNEFGSLNEYLWQYVDGVPIINHYKSLEDVPSQTPLSDRISKDLKKRGMKFVGSTIVYAFMQAVGMVNDHTQNCFKYRG